MSEVGALIYDICSVPDGITMEKIVHIWKEHKLVLYDSHNGETPTIIDPENMKGVLVDMSNTDEKTLKQVQKLLEL